MPDSAMGWKACLHGLVHGMLRSRLCLPALFESGFSLFSIQMSGSHVKISALISLAITSQKGGVGKTTVAINLSHSLACRGWQTLLIDTDPQNSVGLSLSEKTRRVPGFYDVIRAACEVDSFILPTRLPELHLLTAGLTETFFSMRQDASSYAVNLRETLRQISALDYDVVVVDTAAGLMGFTREVVKQVHYALLPQQSEPLGVRSLLQVLEGIGRLSEGDQIAAEVVGILLSMVDPYEEESLQVARELRELLPGDILLRTSIPRDPDFLKASSLGIPVGLLYQKPSPAALVFDQLAAELEPRLQLTPPVYAKAEYTKLLD